MALYVKAGKLTGRVLAKALAAALRRIRDPKAKHGKQSVKSLARKGGGMQNIEITDGNIKSFERVARKYGVDFALKREAEDPTRWLVFFRARDTDTLTAAFQEFTAIKLGRGKDKARPSLLTQLARFKEQAKATPDRERHKEHGGPER